MKVACIEDNPSALALYTTFFRLEGHEVVYFAAGHDFLIALQTEDGSFPFDLVILDWLLPRNISSLDVLLHLESSVRKQHRAVGTSAALDPPTLSPSPASNAVCRKPRACLSVCESSGEVG
jgi:DNA-binding NtrC family response regulator